MIFRLADLSTRDGYKLLTSTVVPRPIALVTSLSEAGVLNAAPFSFFNLIGSDPPLVVLGIGNRDELTPKDSAANILSGGEFVVNLVDEALAPQMNLCAVDFPHAMSEVEVLELETSPGVCVTVPRLTASPASLECTLEVATQIGGNRVIFGRVVALHIRDELVDTNNLHVDTDGLHLVGRMGGGGGYTTTREPFEMARLNYSEWRALKSHSGHTEAR